MAEVENVGMMACVPGLGYWRLQLKKRFYSAKPPRLIELWLDKAPMFFLIVAALTFIAGLNMLAYLSSQVCIPAAAQRASLFHLHEPGSLCISFYERVDMRA